MTMSRLQMSPHSISIGFWNVHGLGKKLEVNDFRNSLEKLDFFSLLETWSNDTSEVDLQHYQHFSSLRNKQSKARRNSGGIIFYFKNKLAKFIRRESSTSESKDILWIRVAKELFGLSRDVFIGNVYISPVNSSIHKRSEESIFDVLEQDVARFTSRGFVILGGDFNSRLGSLKDFADETPIDSDVEHIPILNIPRNYSDKNPPNTFGKDLTDLCYQSNLNILNGRVLGDLSGRFTCYQPNGCSTVDYAIASSTLFHNINIFRVHPLTEFSDHCMISLNIKTLIQESQNETPKINMRPLPDRFVWGPDSSEKFINALRSQALSHKLEIFNLSTHLNSILNADIDKEVHNFQEILEIAGKMSLQIKHNSKQKKLRTNKKWFNKNCFEARKELRNLQYLLQRNPKNPFIRGSYFRKKKEYNKLIRKRKKDYETDCLMQLQNLQENNPTAFWNLLKQFKNANSTPKALEEIPPDSWVTHFKALHEKRRLERQNFDTEFEMKIKDNLKALEELNTEQGPLDCQITEAEISSAITALKNKKASGEDMIINEMLKAGHSLLLKPLVALFNRTFFSGKFPQTWSKSYIVPIFKSGRKDDTNNYRGISISSCLGKLFTSVLNKRLSSFLEENKILKPNQAGFRKNYRTSDNIFVLKTLISKYTQSRNQLFACFVDLSKAFDSIWHEGLLFKLISKGISGRFFDMLKSLYSQSAASVKTNIGLSENFPVKIGVRQGCVLSPSLFNLYISDLADELNTGDFDAPLLNTSEVSSLFYADDLVLLSTSQNGLQNAIDKLGLYCNKWKLSVNINKTKIIVFNKKGHMFSNLKFHILNEDIEIVSSYCYLGVVLTTGCNFTTALKTLQKKALRALFSIKTTLGETNPSISVYCKLFDACVVPILTYGAEVWGKIGLNDKSPIEQVHLKFCKSLLGVRKNSSNLATRAELGRYPLWIEVYTRLYSYYKRLVKEVPRNSLQFEAFLVQQDLHSRNIPCWFSNVSKILEESGFAYLLINSDRNTSFAQSEVNQRLKDNFVQNFYSEMNSPGMKENQGNKLRTYRKFKLTYEREKYLEITNFSYRRAMTKLRISDHPLQIEAGRYTRTPPDDRICMFCNKNVRCIENEMHFVLECSLYNDMRNSLVNVKRVKEKYTNITKVDMFKYLMSSTNYDILEELCKFVYSCFKRRDEACRK